MGIELYKHQRDCLGALKGKTSLLISMQMGLGKTAVAITHLKSLYNSGKLTETAPSLIVCPNIVTENWFREIEVFGSAKMAAATGLLTGTKATRLKVLNNPKHKIFIINYQGLLVLKDLTKISWGCVILDEIHSIANPKAQQSKLCTELSRQSQYRYGLSGTPIRNSYLDLWNIFLFLNQGKELGISFYSYRNKYFYDKNASWRGGKKYFPDWRVREGLIPELQEKVYRNSFRALKEDCLDLPAKIREIRYCDLSIEQAKHYKEIQHELITQIENGTVTASNALVKGLRLTQITSGILSDVEGNTHKLTACGKMTALKETLQEIDLTKDKAIVFGIFRQELLMIQEVIEKMGIKTALLMGGEDNIKAIKSMEEDDTVRVLVANKRIGLGWNCTAANYVIYFSNTYSAVERQQSEDRAHRMGQKKTVTYLDILTRNTIDLNVYQALQDKAEMSSVIIDAIRERGGD